MSKKGANVVQSLSVFQKIGTIVLSLTPYRTPKAQLRYVTLKGVVEFSGILEEFASYLVESKKDGFEMSDFTYDLLESVHPKIKLLPDTLKRLVGCIQLFREIQLTENNGLVTGRKFAFNVEILRLLLKLWNRYLFRDVSRCYSDPNPKKSRAFNLNIFNLAFGVEASSRPSCLLPVKSEALLTSLYALSDICMLMRPVVESYLNYSSILNYSDSSEEKNVVTFKEWSQNCRERELWKSWAASSGLDLAAVLFLALAIKLDENAAVSENLELRRRLPAIILFVLRSPVYEQLIGPLDQYVSTSKIFKLAARAIGLSIYERSYHFASSGI